MEAQNHYYGHSSALAGYAGLDRPRHLPGLLQHGWTAVSPVVTHFRDLPRVGAAGDSRRLFVWSHRSRAWDPADADRPTLPIASPWLYLVAGLGGDLEDPLGALRERSRGETVVLPFHGIQTQKVRGDHAAVAQELLEQEGRTTVCLYATDARDAELVDAYAAAGHRLVTVGERHDAQFLWRLANLLSRAERVVSNRLSTPVFYAAAIGRSVGVYGDTLRLDGETPDAYDRIADVWPEMHGRSVDTALARKIALDELGSAHLLSPHGLRAALGWSRAPAARQARLLADYWVTSPVARARINIARRAESDTARPAERPAPVPPVATSGSAAPAQRLGAVAWFRGALTYLPRPLPRRVPAAQPLPEPFPVG